MASGWNEVPISCFLRILLNLAMIPLTIDKYVFLISRVDVSLLVRFYLENGLGGLLLGITNFVEQVL